MAFESLNELRSVEELASRKTELENEIKTMDAEAAGLPFDAETGERFADLIAERDEVEKRIAELEARTRLIAGFAGREEKTEKPSFYTQRGGATRTEDIYDLTHVRQQSPEKQLDELRDRALRSVDTSTFPDKDAKDRVKELVDNTDANGEIARRILLTGSPLYKRAFSKYVANKPLSSEEQNALERTAMGLSGSAGGYAVPYTVDPSVVLTSNGVINPVRQLARVITITGNHWTGIASAGVTASYDAEAAEVSDDSPTFTQPVADVEMARAFVRYSMELDDDWGALQSEMARLFADAKDTLESSKFLTGLGHSSNEPEGLLVGATGTILTSASSVIAVGDLYRLEEALAPRWRARASFTGSKATYNKIRQLDTAGGANLWVQLQFGQPGNLIGYRAEEWSDMSGGITTPGSSVLTFGDFGEFTIIDRVGMSVELVPQLFHTSNNLPSGQRGLFARWRNTSDVRTAAAFKTLKIAP